MNNELFLKLVGATVIIISSLVSTYLVPWLKSKINREQLATLDYYLELAVKCANQIYTVEQWKEKKEYVTNYIVNVINKKLSLTLSAQDIDTLIEGMVNKVKKEG